VAERQRKYELMVIISPLYATEDGVQGIIERIREAIESKQGEVLSINHNPPWGRRRFSYPIRAYAEGEASRRSFTEGFYVLMHFTLSALDVIELERTIKFTDAILRHLIILLEEKQGRNGTASLDDLDALDDDGDDDEEDEEHDDEGGLNKMEDESVSTEPSR
jgi:small subunit ribosomal protein S6